MSESEEIWQQIDHTLVKLKLESAFRDYVEVIDSYLDFVMDATDNPQDEPVMAWIGRMNDWPKTVYQIYDEVWKKQGNQITPQFIRVVCEKGIIPNMRWLCEQIPFQLSGYATLAGLSDLLKFRAAECEKEWINRCEIEAHELLYEKAVPAKENHSASTSLSNQIDHKKSKAETEADQEEKSEFFNPNQYGGKETAIAVSYKKDRQRDMRKLARILADKAHIRYTLGSHNNPKDWQRDDSDGFTKHISKLRIKARKKGWTEHISREYWKKYSL